MSGAVRSPRTARLFFADPEPFRGVYLCRCPRGQTAGFAVLQPSRGFSVAGAIKAQLQHLLIWSFSKASLLQS